MAIDSISLGIQSFLPAACAAVAQYENECCPKRCSHSQRRSGNVRNFYQRAIKTGTAAARTHKSYPPDELNEFSPSAFWILWLVSTYFQRAERVKHVCVLCRNYIWIHFFCIQCRAGDSFIVLAAHNKNALCNNCSRFYWGNEYNTYNFFRSRTFINFRRTLWALSWLWRPGGIRRRFILKCLSSVCESEVVIALTPIKFSASRALTSSPNAAHKTKQLFTAELQTVKLPQQMEEIFIGVFHSRFNGLHDYVWLKLIPYCKSPKKLWFRNYARVLVQI